ncbi:hypothetical protein THOM_2567 [Trachipleistophora hominis]|uniref:Uncharacterized protein n=1 Tax=Trachipleistophora hominis TaxID=72359 RepID=L7JUM7_TRAHO|nr:hypothetical protein THOM_2567 [Trachipleistophora hominis]
MFVFNKTLLETSEPEEEEEITYRREDDEKKQIQELARRRTNVLQTNEHLDNEKKILDKERMSSVQSKLRRRRKKNYDYSELCCVGGVDCDLAAETDFEEYLNYVRNKANSRNGKKTTKYDIGHLHNPVRWMPLKTNTKKATRTFHIGSSDESDRYYRNRYGSNIASTKYDVNDRHVLGGIQRYNYGARIAYNHVHQKNGCLKKDFRHNQHNVLDSYYPYSSFSYASSDQLNTDLSDSSSIPDVMDSSSESSSYHKYSRSTTPEKPDNAVPMVDENYMIDLSEVKNFQRRKVPYWVSILQSEAFQPVADLVSRLTDEEKKEYVMEMMAIFDLRTMEYRKGYKKNKKF